MEERAGGKMKAKRSPPPAPPQEEMCHSVGSPKKNPADWETRTRAPPRVVSVDIRVSVGRRRAVERAVTRVDDGGVEACRRASAGSERQ